MEPYTLDKEFHKIDVLENFTSLIWTERFYGDSEVELVVPLSADYAKKLATGTFLAIEQSLEPMFIETVNVEGGKIKVKGISVCSWLDNRFIRHSSNHKKTKWNMKGKKPGEVLTTIVKEMCTSKSSYLGGPKNMGLTDAQSRELIVPGLSVAPANTAGTKIANIFINYGPVYVELKRIATAYAVGMSIELVKTDPFSLVFRTYKGLDRTTRKSSQADPVRFSYQMDSFSDIKEVKSIAEMKTLVYAFASNLERIDTSDKNTNPDTWLQTTPGVARRGTAAEHTGFDLRAQLHLATDINIEHDLDETDASGPESTLAGKRAQVRNMLANRADRELKKSKYIQTVDGQVSQTNVFQYKRDYDLGDIIEVEGSTGAIEYSRVTEYIRTHDQEGERSFPTVESIDE